VDQFAAGGGDGLLHLAFGGADGDGFAAVGRRLDGAAPGARRALFAVVGEIDFDVRQIEVEAGDGAADALLGLALAASPPGVSPSKVTRTGVPCPASGASGELASLGAPAP
jgi:hypothetical protein